MQKLKYIKITKLKSFIQKILLNIISFFFLSIPSVQ